MILILKKTWFWIKKHWYLPLIFVGIVLLLFLNRQKAKDLFDLYKTTRRAYTNQTRELEKIGEQEKQRKWRNKQRYEKTLEVIKKKYKDKEGELTRRNKKRIKEIVENNEGRPENMSRLLSEEFGIKYEECN